MIEKNEENDKAYHISIMIYIVLHMHTACATAKGHKMLLLNRFMSKLHNECVSEFLLKTLR